MTKKDSILLKDQISSYFGRIHTKKGGGNGFSVGSITTTTATATAERGGSISHRPASSVIVEKTALFYSQLSTSNTNADPPSPPMTVEEEKASSAARCLAILGATSAAASKPLPTQEEISISRKLREEELMKKYQDIKRIEEENRNRRPLVWAKPTFCPFGGETKSDEAKKSELPEEDKSKSNKKRARDDDNMVSEVPENPLRRVSSSSSIESCSNLLCKPSSERRNSHTNLFPYLMMSGPSSATGGIEWSKDEVDSFVEFTEKWLPSKKKRKVDHQEVTTATSSNSSSSPKNEGEKR